MIIIAVAAGVVYKLTCGREISTRMRLLAAYVVFILIETVLGRKPGSVRVELVPFWSYSHPELRMEIILNYLLFVPLGLLMYLCFGEKRKHGCVWIATAGFLLSASIECIQLVFKIGLFEFDDMIGNTIGCLIGAVVGKMVEKCGESHADKN